MTRQRLSPSQQNNLLFLVHHCIVFGVIDCVAPPLAPLGDICYLVRPALRPNFLTIGGCGFLHALLAMYRPHGYQGFIRGGGRFCGEQQHGGFYITPPPFFSLAKFLGKSRVFTSPKPAPFLGGRVCLAHLTLPLYSIFDQLWATSDLAPRSEAVGIPETAEVT